MLRTSSSFSSLSLFSSVNSRNVFTWSDPHDGDILVNGDVEDVFLAGMRNHHICNTAFPLNHNVTIKPYRVMRTRDERFIKPVYEGAFDVKEMMLYAHVPFCQTRCMFCEYTVVDPKIGRKETAQDEYFDALIEELRLYRNLLNLEKKKLVGFDIGGGTPSMASSDQIDRLMNEVEKSFDVSWNSMEVSIETTPKIAASEPEKLKR